MALTLLVIFVFIFLALSLWRLPILHPVTLWGASWASYVGLFALHVLPYKPLSWATVALICGSSLAFAGGALAAERIAARHLHRLPRWLTDDDPRPVELAAIAALGLTSVILIAFLAQVVRSYGLHDALFVTGGVRAAIGTGAFGVTIKYLYAAIAAAALTAFVAANVPTTRARRWWILASVASIGSIYFATGRGTIVLAAVTALVAYVLARGQMPGARTVIAAVVALTAMAVAAIGVIGGFQGKTFESSDLARYPNVFTDHEVLSPLALPYEYASAPLANLNEQVAVSSTWGRARGCGTLSTACSVLNSAGLNVEPEPLIRPFTAEPLPWNQYTALDMSLIDGGLALAVPITGLIGFVVGAVWSAARRRSVLGVLAYAVFAPTVLMSASHGPTLLAPHLIGAILIGGSLFLISRKTLEAMEGSAAGDRI